MNNYDFPNCVLIILCINCLTSQLNYNLSNQSTLKLTNYESSKLCKYIQILRYITSLLHLNFYGTMQFLWQMCETSSNHNRHQCFFSHIACGGLMFFVYNVIFSTRLQDCLGLGTDIYLCMPSISQHSYLHIQDAQQGFPGSSAGKEMPTMQKTLVRFLGQEDLLGKQQPTHSSILGFPCGSSGKESACNVGDLGSIPGLGRFPEEGKGLMSIDRISID